jgi:hypothetical protein
MPRTRSASEEGHRPAAAVRHHHHLHVHHHHLQSPFAQFPHYRTPAAAAAAVVVVVVVVDALADAAAVAVAAAAAADAVDAAARNDEPCLAELFVTSNTTLQRSPTAPKTTHNATAKSSVKSS